MCARARERERERERDAFDHGLKGGWVVSEGWVCGGMSGWVCRGMGGWVGLRVGFININDMYNNDVGKGECGFMKLMK